MSIQEIVEALEDLLDERYDEGFQAGYDEAVAEAEEQIATADHAFRSGAEEERARIQSIFQMMFDFAMQNNKMAEAKAWKNAMDIIKPIDIDTSEEAYRRSMEEDGF